MVAAAKLRRAQQRLLDARPYADGLRRVMAHVAADQEGIDHPLLEVRELRNVCYLVVTSDRGLCGSFNANVQRRAKNEVDTKREAQTSHLVTFGRKGYEFFNRRGYQIHERYINLLGTLDFGNAMAASNLLQQAFLERQFDRVYAVYNSFKSAGSQVTRVEQLLPVVPETTETQEEVSHIAGFLYEPEPKKLLDMLIPRSLNVQIWRILLESVAAEHGARMVAMDSATESAQEMIHQLTLTYNKARQAAITKEILEIVGGAEALRG